MQDRKFILLILCVLGFLFFYQDSFAGTTGKISGVIRDAGSGEPLPGVNVLLVGTVLGAATDGDGHYFIINIPPGVYTVEATMIGYETLRKTDVRVLVDHTTPVEFELKSSVIAGEEVTVVAEREVIQMDMSASQVTTDVDRIEEVPIVREVMEFINLQAGVENDAIRGGGLDQTGMVIDGLTLVDNRTNEPILSVNLSSIQEISIIKGGFNAEYGNVRSGMINIVTKDPRQQGYNGSIDFRFTPARLKHSGASLFDPMNYYLRSYLDPAVAMKGTSLWDEETRSQYPEFEGWEAYAERINSDANPNNDMTADEAMQRFIWRHRAEGAAALGRDEGEYGNKPDWTADLSLSGPVPLIGQYLGNMGFFASYRNNWEMFGLPTSREYYKENSSFLKLISRITPQIKLGIDGLYGETKTVTRNVGGGSIQNYLTSGYDIFNSSLATTGGYSHTGDGVLYAPYGLNPFNIYRGMVGFTLDHVLSPSTFYNLRLSFAQVKHFNSGPDRWRDTTTVRYFGNYAVDEAPLGYWAENGQETMVDNMKYGAEPTSFDYSKVRTLNIKFDLSSQIDKYNLVKLGFDLTSDDFYTEYGQIRYAFDDNWLIDWENTPIRFGAYLQDKLEFEGMIANFGFRLDYSNPNTDWYTVEVYSEYFKQKYKNLFIEEAPKEPTKSNFKISPRLGISHPVSQNAKIFFNYGHFYSMPRSSTMYEVYIGGPRVGIVRIGNPSLTLPKTVAYELGVEYNIADMFLLHLTGYYKDVTDQTGTIRYINYDGSVDYQTYANNDYEDIRGFELRFEKNFGRWIRGWLNYNYMANSRGQFGRDIYYENPLEQALLGLKDPTQERPTSRPYARANILIGSPPQWGPMFLGGKPFSNIQLSFIGTWKAGKWETWDPLETQELRDNLQWEDTYDVNVRLSKLMRFGRYNFDLFLDVNNLFNFKFISEQGFFDGNDREKYLRSLHLPMYEGQEYLDQGLVAGEDVPGDVKSDEKSYIDMPNRGFLSYINPRYVVFGLRVHF